MRKRYLIASVLILTIVGIVSAFGLQNVATRATGPLILDRDPVRTIVDQYTVFSGITMAEGRDELIVTDDAQSGILTYRTQFEPTNRVSEPIRQIRGEVTRLGYVCGVAVSPEHNELYAVTGDDEWASVFPLEANGDVAPTRTFVTDHGSAGISLDRKNDELYITSEHINKVAVFARNAKGEGQERRFIQGPLTGLADPHGVHVDSANNEVYVSNHGNWRKTEAGEKYASIVTGTHKPTELRPSTGRFLPPSVSVYSRTANGDVAPLRLIQGPKTGLNLPLGLYFDSVANEIIVANSGDQSVLFFARNAHGDVAPTRAIKGPFTGLAGPTGIYVDAKRKEIWVSNWDNHSATVYPMNASGNVRPLRTLRSAPEGTRYAGFGNIGDVAFDPKRKQILVPN